MWGTTPTVQCPAEVLLHPKVQQSQSFSCPELSQKSPQWKAFAHCTSLPAHPLPFIFPAPCYNDICPWFCALGDFVACSLSSLSWPAGLGFSLGKWNADMPPTASSLSPLSSAAEEGEPALTRREYFHISCRLWSQSVFQVTQSQQQPEQGELGGKAKAW